MNVKQEFPILKKITYLDSGSSLLKPVSVIRAIQDFYLNKVVNPHSLNSPLSLEVVAKMETTRKAVAQLVGAEQEEVIFTSGTTDGLNAIVCMLQDQLKPGDEVIILKYNHNSNILPWLKLEQLMGIKVIIADDIEHSITKRTKVVSISQKNNAIGPHADMKKIYKLVHPHHILLINDAAQAVAWEPVSLDYCDVIAMSANKLYGPTGVGALVVKKDLLATLKPIKLGGGMIATIGPHHQYAIRAGVPGFEAGTPNTAGIIGFGAAIEFFHQTKALVKKTMKLSLYAYKQLAALVGIRLHTQPGQTIIIFDYKNYNPQDVVSKLAHKYAIYIRSGLFCAHLAGKNQDGSIRVSLGIHNTKADIDKLVQKLKTEDFYTLE